MTRNEALLTQLAEEASEVAQAASKCNRFGVEHTWHTHVGTAERRLFQEYVEVVAVMEMCIDAGLVTPYSTEEYFAAIKAKREKVEKYLKVSMELGCVQ
jgi:hypothetical protein